MPFTLTLPKLSPTMEEGVIAKWHVKEGDYVEVGELLLEVSTDKATVEYNAIDSGYIRKRLIEEGGEAAVNEPIAIFTEEEKESIEGYVPEGEVATVAVEEEKPKEQAAQAPKISKEQVAASLTQPAFVPEPPISNYPTGTVPSMGSSGRIKASPLARRLAKERSLDLTTVQGTGPGGRIMERDLVKAMPLGEFAFGRSESPKELPGSYEEEALTPIRKVISQRLQESKSFIPHFYVQQTVDAGALVALREQLKTLGLKVSVNDCVIRACALALRKFPGVNSGFNSVTQSIVHFKTVDISVAVSLEGGLITPIIRHADYKNLGEISLEVRALAKRGKAGKLEAEEYKGGSFTVSNLGMYGVTSFQAIINPPQSSILAVSGILDTPVVKGGEVVPGKVMNITLSSDHRVVDGVLGAQFVNSVKYYLENPASLIL